MTTINSDYLELIEQEIADCKDKTYYKTIPIKRYDYQMKLTLDLLVEKYGGFIYRYDDNVTLLINFSNIENKMVSLFNEQNQINESLKKRLEDLEEQLVTLLEERNKQYFTYLDYFKQPQSKETLKLLIDEIINNN
jgi:dsDNA-specific endonuclease/ATPase MutS2